MADGDARRVSQGARIAVIGSGFGGLAAAIRLQAAGCSVVMYEARDKPGGRAYVYDKGGFAFDAGPTVITAPDCLTELFELAGRPLRDSLELLPVTPFYRLLWPDGDRFDYGGNAAAMLAQIRQRSPRDAAGYERFLEYSRRVFSKGYEELAATPFLRFADMLRVAPDLARLRADRSVYATVARFVQDEHLRQAFSFHSLLVGGNPFDTSAIYTLIHYLEREWGVFFPRGGTGALVRALVRTFEELGGEVRLSTPVERIEVTAEGARTVHRVHAHGASEPFESVVSNADVHHTYAKLYRDHPAAARTAQKLERLDWSMSLFVLYFGVAATFRGIAHHTVLFGPRYRELLREIFHGPTLPEDFSLYLHAPCVTDPSMAPEGHSAFYVLSPVPHLGHAPIDWDTVGPRYAARILEEVEQRVLPGLRRRIVTQHFITPRNFQQDLAAYQGSAFSIAPRLGQSAWFRPHNQDAKIPGLYIVGAGTHPGAGLPGVINSAKATVGLMLGRRAVPAQRELWATEPSA
jgi:phytoene desaturase